MYRNNSCRAGVLRIAVWIAMLALMMAEGEGVAMIRRNSNTCAAGL